MRLPLSLALATLPALPMGAVAAPAAPPPLHVAVVWHQHQPQYPLRPGGRVYEQPWVRLHAAKDYHDMAAMARAHPGLKLTVNLTPVLLSQLDAYNAGATDRHAELAAKDATRLTAAEKAEAHDRFFQVSGPMMARWPRLAALEALPPARWDAQAYRDAATLFHLAWTDPGFLAQPPLAAIARKGRGFSEADKAAVLAAHRRIMADVVPLHRKLQEEGRLEVTTTPYFHPILPLVHDSALAKEALPQAPLPGRYQWPADAKHHVDAAVVDYTKRFGRAPRGMWPGEGSVAQAVAPLFKAAGIRWIATDEDVLARSLGTKLRDGEALSPAGARALYKPYQVKDGPAIVFRDRKLSDDIGFRYAKMPGAAAAKDLLDQLRAVQRQGKPGEDRLVSIVLDGENAWENYPDDGKAFLGALYRGLTTDPAFRSTTPSAYLASHRPTPLARLWSGSWIGASYATWIGEDEENRAWELLVRARAAVAAHGKAHGEAHPGYRRAMAKIYAAEGSDWFWWYGQDQDSGRDHEFDAAYRGLLAAAYRDLGRTPPADLALPIVQQGATPTREPSAYLRPRLDGPMDRTEWAQAGSLFAEGGAMAVGGRPFDALFYGWDRQHLYLAVQHAKDAQPFSVLLGLPGRAGGQPIPPAPFLVHAGVDVDARGQGTMGFPGKPGPAIALQSNHGLGTTELAIRWDDLGARSGDAVTLVLRTQGAVFPARPLTVRAPVLEARPLVGLRDAKDAPDLPLPTGGAYTREAIDLQALEVGEEAGEWAFTWKLGAIRDPWKSPVGLSLVALECYVGPAIFVEGRLPAPVPLLDARDAKAARPWTHVVAVEGWQQGLYGPDGTKRAEVAVAVDPFAGLVRARVPKAALPGDPGSWAFLATLAGQDGFAPGRVRQVLPVATAERFGGRPSGRGSNLLDVLLPAGVADEASLLGGPTGQVILPLVRPAE